MKKTINNYSDITFPDTAEIESLVLADAVNSPENIGDIMLQVHPEFFTTTARRNIWEAIMEQYNKGARIDLVSMHSLCGEDFLHEVLPFTQSAGGPHVTAQHVSLLRDGNTKRRACYAAITFLQKASEAAATESDILSSTELFMRTVEGPAPLQSELKLSKVIEAVKVSAKEAERDRNAGEDIRISTGFHYMDEVLNGGWKAGQLVVLAARPSVGKTAVMLQMAKTAAAAGHPVQIYSLEMTSEELGERLLFSTGEVRPYQLTHGEIDWDAFARAEGMLGNLPVFVNDFSRKLDDIVNRLTQAVKQGRCSIAFIDYLGLMQDCLTNGQIKLYQVIANITGTLKAVAKRLHISIVLLSQLNREQVREKRSPELYDLRDSGSIEQDSDVVIMLESKMEEERRIYAWLRKNRAGKRDIAFTLVPNDTYSAFTEGLPKSMQVAPDLPVEETNEPF